MESTCTRLAPQAWHYLWSNGYKHVKDDGLQTVQKWEPMPEPPSCGLSLIALRNGRFKALWYMGVINASPSVTEMSLHPGLH